MDYSLRNGVISGIYGAYYEVIDLNSTRLKKEYLLKPRGKLRMNVQKNSYREIRQEKNILTVGDQVEFRLNKNIDSKKNDLDGHILAVQPRKNYLQRTNAYRMQVMAANIDQVYIISSIDAPIFNPGFIDRILVETILKGIPTLLILNKMDLLEIPAEIENYIDSMNRFSYFQTLGLDIAYTSFKNNHSILNKIRERMKYKKTFLIGQSGVGKSTFLNYLGKRKIQKTTPVLPGKKGKHTTVNTKLIQLEDEITVIDSPGMREFSLNHIRKEDIQKGFLEIKKHHCQYANCLHINEPGCSVLDGLKDQHIFKSRYESYRSIIESFNEKFKPRRGDYWRGIR